MKIGMPKKLMAVLLSVMLVITGVYSTRVTLAATGGDTIGTLEGTYEDYIQPDTLFGIAGEFHIFAQESAKTMVHTNGNIATHVLNMSTNFGTNQATDEYTYARYFFPGGSDAIKGAHIVIGRNNYVTVNGAQVQINGGNLSINVAEAPDRLLYEDETQYFIDLDKEFVYLRALSKAIAGLEENLEGFSATQQSDIGEVTLQADTFSVMNVTGAELAAMAQKLRVNQVQIAGTTTVNNETYNIASGSHGLIINIDLAGYETYNIGQQVWYTFTDGTTITNKEETYYTGNNILFNVYDSSSADGQYHGKLTNSMDMLASILAPCADVEANAVNGTVIGKTVITTGGETHRSDFAVSNIPGLNVVVTDELVKIAVNKVDENAAHLTGATFEIRDMEDKAVSFKTSATGDYVTEFVVDGDGTDLWLEAGQYYLVETAAPEGYLLNTTKIPFEVTADGTVNSSFTIQEYLNKQIDNISAPLTSEQFTLESDGTASTQLTATRYENVEINRMDITLTVAADAYAMGYTGLFFEMVDAETGVVYATNYATSIWGPTGGMSAASDGTYSASNVTLTQVMDAQAKVIVRAYYLQSSGWWWNATYTPVDTAITSIEATLLYGYKPVEPDTKTLSMPDFASVSNNEIYVENTLDPTQVEPEVGNLLITVEEEGTGTAVEGAVVEVTSPSGTKTDYTTDEYGAISLENIPTGDYNVVVTDIPDGYKIVSTDDATVTVPADETATHETVIAPMVGDIQITVTEEGTDAPVPDVKVVVTDSEGNEEAYYTDENGEILIPDVPVGDYDIVVEEIPEGYEIVTGETGDVTVEDDKTATHEATITQQVGNLEIIVTEEESGEAVPGATVEVTYPDGSKEEYTTEDDGTISLPDVPVGDYDIVVKEVPEGYEVTTGESDTVTVKKGETTTHEAEIAPETGNLEIIVTEEETGEAVPGATVEVTYPNGSKETYTTEDDGTISLPDVPVGDYDIVVKEVPEGYEVTTGESDTVTVKKGETTTHEAEIATETGNLEIIVTEEETGEAVPGATVEVTYPNGSKETYTTEDDGTISLPDVPVGDYDIVVKEVPEGYEVTTGESDTVTVEKGETTTHEAEIAPELGTLEIIVTEEGTNAPVEGAKVEVTYPNGSKETYTTGEGGTISLPNVPVGEYNVVVTQIPDGYKIVSTDATAVTVPANDTAVHETVIAQKLGNLEIIVTEEETGEPVPGAKVEVTYPDGSKETYTTEDDGTIDLPNVPVGDYGIVVEEVPDGYEVTTGKADTATVVEGETTVHEAEIAPTVEEPVTGTLEIIVTEEETGEPVPGAKVEVTTPSGSKDTYTTNDKGKITIPDTPVGDYDIVVKEVPEGYEVTTGETDTVTVEKDETTTHEAEIAPETGNLEIIVTEEETGEVVPGAKVEVTYPDGSKEEYTTEEDGTISLPDVPVGDYDIVVKEVPEGYEVTTGETDTVTVEKDETTTHEAEIAPETGNLEIIVTEEETGEVVPGAKVEVTYPDGSKEEYTTEEDGTISLPDVPVGDYDIVVKEVPEGYEVTTGETDTVTVEKGETTTHEAEIAPKDEEQKTGDLVIVVTDDKTGEPVPGAKVEVTYPDGSKETYTTEDDGTIDFPNVPVGDYDIVVKEVPDGYEVVTGESDTVTVEENKTTTHEATIAPETGNLEIIVTEEESGEVVPGAKVEVTYPDGSKEEYTTEEDGTISLPDVPVGDYDIVVKEVPEGYEVTTGESDTVTVEKGETTTHEAEIAPETGNLEIIVTEEESGEVVPGAKVEVTYPDGSKEEYTTEDDGTISLPNVPVGDYDIVVKEVPEGYEVTTGKADSVTVEKDKTTTHEAEIAPKDEDQKTGTLEIIVTDDKTGEVVPGAKVEVTTPSGSKDTYTTNENGKITIPDTPVGDYDIVVKEVPEGYEVVTGESDTVTVEENKTTTHEATIAPETGNLEIIVTEEESGEVVPGAKVEVTYPDGSKEEYTTEEDGTISLPDVPVGDYDIVVKEVPEGYEVTTGESDTVTVEKDKTTTHEAEIAPEIGNLEIIVTEEETGNVVPGAKVEVTYPDGSKEEYTTEEDGTISLPDVPVGDYDIVVKEVPDGYVVRVGESDTVTVEAGKTAVHEAQIGTQSSGSQAGDRFPVMPVVIAMVTSAVLVVLTGTRKKEEEQ